MMELEENKSQIWYKVLNEDDCAMDNPMENLKKHLPQGDKKGSWYESPIPGGSMLVSNPRALVKGDSKVFIVELSGRPQSEKPGEIYLKKFRLVREATKKELSRFSK